MARLRRAVCAAYFPSREQVRSPLCVYVCPSTLPQQPAALTPSPPCQERLAFLHNIIRARREWLVFAMCRGGTQRLAGTGKSRLFLILISRSAPPGGGKGQHHPWGSVARTPEMALPHGLLLRACRFPALVRLTRFLGIQHKHCLICGAAEQPGFNACITPDCKGRSSHSLGTPSPENATSPLTAPFSTGLYCSECYAALNNTCSVCMAPLSYPDSGDEEM